VQDHLWHGLVEGLAHGPRVADVEGALAHVRSDARELVQRWARWRA